MCEFVMPIIYCRICGKRCDDSHLRFLGKDKNGLDIFTHATCDDNEMRKIKSRYENEIITIKRKYETEYKNRIKDIDRHYDHFMDQELIAKINAILV